MIKHLLTITLSISIIGVSSLSYAASDVQSNPVAIDDSKNHLLIRAKAGNGPSQVQLMEQYLTSGDYKNALYWAERFEPYPNTDPNVFNLIGNIYVETIKSSDSLDEQTIQSYYDYARYWYEKADAEGLHYAQFNLAKMYYLGEGVDKNLEKAAEYLQHAAESGLLDARNTLGTMYAKGEGVPMDKEKAVYWYKQAADYGFANAQYNLAIAYYNGSGIEKDLEKSEELFLKSCMNGNEKACENFASGFN